MADPSPAASKTARGALDTALSLRDPDLAVSEPQSETPKSETAGAVLGSGVTTVLEVLETENWKPAYERNNKAKVSLAHAHSLASVVHYLRLPLPK